jgi:hypothetical protein
MDDTTICRMPQHFPWRELCFMGTPEEEVEQIAVADDHRFFATDADTASLHYRISVWSFVERIRCGQCDSER